jgi:cytochrome c553
MKRMLSTTIIAFLGMVGTAHAAGDAQAGKAKAAACGGCHGANGEGVGSNPPLAGMGEDKFVQAMQDYKSGKRASPIMKPFASSLSDQDVANMGAYYASLPKK